MGVEAFVQQRSRGSTLKVPAHILLVEDDEVDAEVVFRAFARQNIANPLVHAVDGLAALAVLRGEMRQGPSTSVHYPVGY